MSQQMPVVYPVTNTIPPSTHSSNGSYGSVFIVLAVIVTISAFACFLGRICNKREAKPARTNNLSTKEKDANKRDIEFGYDKRFASAKVATNNEPTMANPNPFGEPNMVRPNSFHEPKANQSSQSSSFHKTNKVQPGFSPEPVMGRPNSFHEPTIGRPNSFHEPKANQSSQSGSFHKTNKVQPSFAPEPVMGRPNSFHEPTMGQPNSFHKSGSQGDQVGFGGDRDNEINFKFRTRPQRY